jgi:hypothetical protein
MSATEPLIATKLKTRIHVAQPAVHILSTLGHFKNNNVGVTTIEAKTKGKNKIHAKTKDTLILAVRKRRSLLILLLFSGDLPDGVPSMVVAAALVE